MAVIYLEPREFAQGTTYTETINVTDSTGEEIDLSTGYTALFQIREGTVDSGAVVLVELTDDDGVVLGDGQIDITISATTTETAVSDTSKNKLYAELDLETEGAVESFRWELKVSREYARGD